MKLGAMTLQDEIGENMSKDETKIGRVKRSREEAKLSYDKMSRWYDILTCRFEKKFRDFGLQRLSVREGEAVLEVGSGTGHCLPAFAQSVGNKGTVYGIDLSEGMVRIALSRVKEAGLSENVELLCGDAEMLPFKANFDAVFMSFTLELFDTPEIPDVLGECRRVLRSGGRICVVSMLKEEKAGLIVRLYEWAHRKFPNYFDCRPIFVRRALEDAGFQVLNSTEMSLFGLPVEVVVAEKMASPPRP